MAAKAEKITRPTGNFFPPGAAAELRFDFAFARLLISVHLL
jgi:hypothetical protein